MLQEKSHPRDRKTPLWKPVVAILAVLVLIVAGLVSLVIVGITSIGSSNSESCEAGSPASQAIVGVDESLAVPKKLREEQISNAKIIDDVVRELGLSGKASKIAIVAAMGESTLINIGFGDEGQGVTNPDGSPTTSKGLFQQQTSTGWGTVEQVTDPQHATKSFLLGPKHDGTTQGLVTVTGWEIGEITQVIHKVQANANPNHYADSYGPADQIIQEAGIDVNRTADESKQGSWRKNAAKPADASAAPDSAPGSAANLTGCSSDGGAQAGVPGKSGNGKNTYPWDHLAPPPGVYNADPLSFFYGECTSYAAWKVNEAMGGSATNIVFNNAYGGHIKGNGAEWKAAWEASGWTVSNTPKVDSVAWWGAGGGEGVGSAGHVGWVDEVTEDGKVIISEYNNSFYGPPGHEYSRRPTAIDPSQVNAYLYVPEKK